MKVPFVEREERRRLGGDNTDVGWTDTVAGAADDAAVVAGATDGAIVVAMAFIRVEAVVVDASKEVDAEDAACPELEVPTEEEESIALESVDEPSDGGCVTLLDGRRFDPSDGCVTLLDVGSVVD